MRCVWCITNGFFLCLVVYALRLRITVTARTATDTAVGWLTRACKPHATLEPRFWTVPPAYHVQELCFCLLAAAAAAALSRSCSNSRSTPPRLPTTSLDRTTLETALGACLVLWLPINICNKTAVQGTHARSNASFRRRQS